MYTIGIDVSKKELVSAKVTKRGEIIERWTIPNEPVAIAHWLDALPHALLGAEATAEYHNELARQCIARGVPFKLLNPIVTKQFTRATVRRRKTDRSDAEVIARCLLNGDGYLLSMESLSPVRRLLRTSEKPHMQCRNKVSRWQTKRRRSSSRAFRGSARRSRPPSPPRSVTADDLEAEKRSSRLLASILG